MRNDKNRKSGMFVRSLGRGLSAILSFDSESPFQTLAQVASKTNMDRASARRMLHTLESLGYLRLEGRNFHLTPRVLDLGYRYLVSLPFWSVAAPVMGELTRAVNETSAAAVLEGTDIVFIVQMPVSKIIAVRIGVGMRYPAYCTSLGRILLGGLPDVELDRVLRASKIKKHTKYTVTSIPALKKLIRQDRDRGWSIVQHELEQGLSAVAVPIFDDKKRIVAAVNVTGHVMGRSHSKLISEVLPRLKEAAEEIQSLIQNVGNTPIQS